MASESNSLVAIYSWVDDTMVFLVRGIYESLVLNNTALITTLFAISVALYGILILKQYIQEPVQESLRHILLLGLIAVILNNYEIFHQFVYAWFLYAPDAFAGAIFQALDDQAFDHLDSMESGRGAAAISIYMDKVFMLAARFWEGGSLEMVGAVLVLICAFLLFTALVGLLIMTRLFVAILLAEAPLFFMFLIFKSTRGLFEGWLRQLWSMFLTQLLAYAMMAVLLMILRHPVQQLSDGTVLVNFSSIVSFALLICSFLFILKNLGGMASSIAGGFQMQQYNAYENGMGKPFKTLGRHARNGLVKRFGRGG